MLRQVRLDVAYVFPSVGIHTANWDEPEVITQFVAKSCVSKTEADMGMGAVRTLIDKRAMVTSRGFVDILSCCECRSPLK